MLAGFRVVPHWTLLRFGMWEEMLREPAPPSGSDFLTGAWHYARGEARARSARNDAHGRQPGPADVLAQRRARHPGRGRAHAGGPVAAAEGRHEAAIAALDLAVRREDAPVHTEPREWAYPPRHALARVLLQAGRAPEAETVRWQDLMQHPENGWAPHALAHALRAQGKGALAMAVQEPFAKACARADVRSQEVKDATARAGVGAESGKQRPGARRRAGSGGVAARPTRTTERVAGRRCGRQPQSTRARSAVQDQLVVHEPVVVLHEALPDLHVFDEGLAQAFGAQVLR